MLTEKNEERFLDTIHVLYDSLLEFDERLTKIRAELDGLSQEVNVLKNYPELKECLSIIEHSLGDRNQINFSPDVSVPEVEIPKELETKPGTIPITVSPKSEIPPETQILQGLSETPAKVLAKEEIVSSNKEEDVVTINPTVLELSDTFPRKIIYYGAPSGSGFEYNDSLSSRESVKTLYVVEQIENDKALFYPINEKFTRLKNNYPSLMEPVCSVEGDIANITFLNISEADYGMLVLEDNCNYWKVVKKCVIK